MYIIELRRTIPALELEIMNTAEILTEKRPFGVTPLILRWDGKFVIHYASININRYCWRMEPVETVSHLPNHWKEERHVELIIAAREKNCWKMVAVRSVSLIPEYQGMEEIVLLKIVIRVRNRYWERMVSVLSATLIPNPWSMVKLAKEKFVPLLKRSRKTVLVNLASHIWELRAMERHVPQIHAIKDKSFNKMANARTVPLMKLLALMEKLA